MKQAEIETERLRLQPWSDAYLPLLIELSSDPRVVRWIGLGVTWPDAMARAVSERQKEHWAHHGFGWRGLLEKQKGEQIGFAALNFLGDGATNLDPDEFEIGWWLSPSAWGRGFALEAGRALLGEAFGRVGAPSVVARIQPPNEPSIRVARTLGLEHEARTTGSHGESLEIFRKTAEDFQL